MSFPSSQRSPAPVREVDVEVLPKGRRGVGERGVQDPLLAFIAKMMDSAFSIPGTNVKLGMDAIIGLIPGFGGGASALISIFFLLRSAQQGVPNHVLIRMAGNILANTVLDEIPIIGDVATIFFRSNNRNYELLQKHAGTRRPPTAKDRVILWALVIGIILTMICTAIGFYFLIRFLWNAILG
jgi:hypothetical protein